ncbi:hypothetical protein COCMIDRAFT_33779 [Bipolaris oryzae ATCC 44560]|uniref:Uncharacterized protein n=1 Tax=Bipolaris oryzae ATCC 44560 TaxID=930090 RepID=W6ZFB3_COCMI|nr:uncharacterized protein COCMIDRAFT_33779 [Bipolaris oryzae ATCC 44560]EUC48705.1 hypothetical protein COCMIDRAFT_33779 [Bipolaris oryzae ATCC 44560]
MLHHVPRTTHATLLYSLPASPPSSSPSLPRAQRIRPLRARTTSPRTHLPLSSPVVRPSPLHHPQTPPSPSHPNHSTRLEHTHPLRPHLPLRTPFPSPLSDICTVHRITV